MVGRAGSTSEVRLLGEWTRGEGGGAEEVQLVVEGGGKGWRVLIPRIRDESSRNSGLTLMPEAWWESDSRHRLRYRHRRSQSNGRRRVCRLAAGAGAQRLFSGCGQGRGRARAQFTCVQYWAVETQPKWRRRVCKRA